MIHWGVVDSHHVDLWAAYTTCHRYFGRWISTFYHFYHALTTDSTYLTVPTRLTSSSQTTTHPPTQAICVRLTRLAAAVTRGWGGVITVGRNAIAWTNIKGIYRKHLFIIFLYMSSKNPIVDLERKNFKFSLSFCQGHARSSKVTWKIKLNLHEKNNKKYWGYLQIKPSWMI